MSYQIVLSDGAQLQISKSANWFFNQIPGLELKFLDELDKAIVFIQKHPLKCQCRYRNVRVKFLKKFDFGIHFIMEKNVIFVLSIFHTRQNAEDWF